MVCLQSLHSVGVVTIGLIIFGMPFHVCYLVIWLFVFVLHMVLHGFCFYIYFSFFFLLLHGLCVMGIMSYVLVEGLILLFMYHLLYVYFLLSLIICIPSFFSSCYALCAYFFFHICPWVFLFPFCVSFIHAWMKTFGGCMHMHFIICSYMWILKCVYLTYFVIFDIISQDSNVKHVIFW